MSRKQNIYQKVAGNILKYRKEAGFTQEELASEAGLNRAYIGFIERCKRRPSVETLESIAKALGVEVYRLFVFE